MLVYMDIFTDDEVISDVHNLTDVTDKEGNVVPGLMKCESRTVTKGGDDVDIGCGDAFGGGNADVDDNSDNVNNIIDSNVGFGYTETSFNTKSEVMQYLKQYFRRILGYLKDKEVGEEKMKVFKDEARAIAQYLGTMYSELQYFMFKSCDATAGCAFAYYAEGASTPTFMFIKSGLKECKF